MACCCICNVKPGEFPLDSAHPDLLICQTCSAAKRGIETAAPTAKFNAQYLEKLLPNIQDDTVKSILEDIMKPPEELKAEVERRAEQRQKTLGSIMLTSGFNFEGYVMTRYLDFISEEVVMGTGFFKNAAGLANTFGLESQSLRQKLADAKTSVMAALRSAAFDQGANAIIGVDLDYSMFGDSLIAVIMNGTAVVIEPLEK